MNIYFSVSRSPSIILLTCTIWSIRLAKYPILSNNRTQTECITELLFHFFRFDGFFMRCLSFDENWINRIFIGRVDFIDVPYIQYTVYGIQYIKYKVNRNVVFLFASLHSIILSVDDHLFIADEYSLFFSRSSRLRFFCSILTLLAFHYLEIFVTKISNKFETKYRIQTNDRFQSCVIQIEC